MPKIVCIIQARMGSSRLHGKVLVNVEGRPMLRRVVDRVSQSRRLVGWIVAIPDTERDDILNQVCYEWGSACYRGSEGDLLDRYYRAAVLTKADIVVRVTSDCPLVDPAMIDKTIEFYVGNKRLDYATFGDIRQPVSTIYPDGMDAEVFSMGFLTRAWKEADEREHVGSWMLKNGRYGFVPFRSGLDRPVKLSVDTLEDLERVSRVVRHVGNSCSVKEVFEYLKGVT